MYETLVTVVGNVVDNPRLRRTEKGADVTSFRIASTARKQDRTSGEWVDGDKLFLSVSCWRQLAVNAMDSLRRGDPVLVSGKLSTREYEKDGQRRVSFELEASAVGHDLSRGTAVFSRTRRDALPTFEVIDNGPAAGEPGDGEPGTGPAAELPADRAAPVLVTVG